MNTVLQTPRNCVPLHALQQWMQSQITQCPLQEIQISFFRRSSQQPFSIPWRFSCEQLVRSSPQLSSEARIGIYQNAYLLRLAECLQNEFPVLQATIGEEAFHQFATEYVIQHPSSSYTLARLADRFVDYLKCSRLQSLETDTSSQWSEFVIQLAHFEWTIGQVFDGPGMEQSPPNRQSVLADLPSDDLASVRLIIDPSLRLLQLKYPLHEYYLQMRNKLEPSMPVCSDTFIAVFRRGYQVRFEALGRCQWHLLSQLAQGATIAASVEYVVEHENLDGEDLPQLIYNWFESLSSRNFFLSSAPGSAD